MRTVKTYLIAIACAMVVAGAGRQSAAQTTQPGERRDPTGVTRVSPGAQPKTAEPVEIDRIQEEFDRRYWSARHIVFRLGQDYTLRAGESVREVFVLNSGATIEGFVRGDVTVVLGDVKLGSTAVLGGC